MQGMNVLGVEIDGNAHLVGHGRSDMTAAARPVILRASGLTKEFHGFVAVNGVDLAVHEGGIHALIGPNGAGKTTVFNLLTKFLEPTRGRIFCLDRDITALGPDAVARLGIVRSFQISAIFANLRVLDNVRIALQRPAGLATQFWRSRRALERLSDRAMELLISVNLADYAHRSAGELPYGRKRALEIATTLALDPKILLLDEPMAGLGREDIVRVAELLKRIGRGRTVLMVEHNLSVVADICDRVTVLQRGEILAEGSYAEVSADPQVREAYIGSDHA